MSESSHLQESSVHYNIPELQSAPGRPPQHSQSHANAHSFPHPLSHPHPQPNGQHSVPLHREASGTREDLSGPDDSEEEEDEEEEEAPVSKWQGIESIFEAYQEYVEGKQPQQTRSDHTATAKNRITAVFMAPLPRVICGFHSSNICESHQYLIG